MKSATALVGKEKHRTTMRSADQPSRLPKVPLKVTHGNLSRTRVLDLRRCRQIAMSSGQRKCALTVSTQYLCISRSPHRQ